MKKGPLPMISAINTLLKARLSKDKTATAEAAINKAEEDFAKSCEKEIELLKAKRAIVVQERSEHVFDPPRSVIMRLELAVTEAKAELETAIETAKASFVSNLVDQALDGEVRPSSFKTLHRINQRDFTLQPLREPAVAVKRAEEELEDAIEDGEMIAYDKDLEIIDAEITSLESMLK